MSVHYKFKSALEYDTVTFDGLHISVKDLKKAIIHQKRIGKNTDFDLQVTNAQTKEVYTDENALIPKNTSLVIARIPLVAQAKSKAWEGYGAQAGTQGAAGSARPEDGVLSKAVDLTQLDASEDDKIRAMMTQSTLDYDPSNYMKIRGSNQVGVVPAHYRCFKCHQPGHWIKDCPLGHGQEPMEIKKSTGIPRSFMVPVEGPMVPGAMMTPTGQYAVPVLDHQAYNEGHKVAVATQEEKPEIPEDLLCSICKDLLTDAVMIPCCGNSFCDECIRTVLLESEDHECPDCHEKDISPGTLIPNRFLRNSVSNFKNETGYHKRHQYRNAVQRDPVAVAQEPQQTVETKPIVQESVVHSAESTTTETQSLSPSIKKEQVKPDSNTDEEPARESQKPIISEADSTETAKVVPVKEEIIQEKPASPPSSDGPPGVESPVLETQPVSAAVDAPPGVDLSPTNAPSATSAPPPTVKQGQAITSVGGAVNHHKVSHHVTQNSSSGRIQQNVEHSMQNRHYTSQIPPPYTEPAALEERPGTPTVDEPGIGPPGYSSADTVAYADAPPPGLLPTATTLPPSQHMHPPPRIQGPPPQPALSVGTGPYSMPPVSTHQPPPNHYTPTNPPPPTGYRLPPPGHPDFGRVGPSSGYGDLVHPRVLLVTSLDPSVPPPTVAPTQGNFGPRPLYDPTRPPYDPHRPPMHGPPAQSGYPAYPPGPRMGGRPYPPPRHMQPPPPGLAHRTPTHTIPNVIDDPLEAFNRMLREKDERDRRARQSRRVTRSRSYSRSRSSSRSFSRSPRSRSRTPPRHRSRHRSRTRSPPPRSRRTPRSRSRSFSISRSRSFSRSPSFRGSPVRDYSPRRRPPSRYRSPLSRATPPRYRYKDSRPLLPDRDRDRLDRDRVDRDRERTGDRDRDYSYYEGGVPAVQPPAAAPALGPVEYEFDAGYEAGRPGRSRPPLLRNPRYGLQPTSTRKEYPLADPYYPTPDMCPPAPYPPPHNRYNARGPNYPPPLMSVKTVPPLGILDRADPVVHRKYEDVPPPGVEQPPVPGFENQRYDTRYPPPYDRPRDDGPPGVDRYPRSSPYPDRDDHRDPERLRPDLARDYRDKPREPLLEDKERFDRKYSPSPDRRQKSLSPRRTSRDRFTTPDKNRRRKRDESSDRDKIGGSGTRTELDRDKRDKKKDTSEDEKSKKSRDKKKKKERREAERKKKKEKREKKEQEKLKKAEEKKAKEAQENNTEDKKPDAEPPKIEREAKPIKVEIPSVKEIEPKLRNDLQKPGELQPKPKVDLYDDILSEGIDNSVVENYGKIDSKKEDSFLQNETRKVILKDDVIKSNEGDSEEKDTSFDGLELQANEAELKADFIENKSKTNEVLAPVPEPSKWEIDEDVPTTPEKNPTVESKVELKQVFERPGKVVTSEVLKRAENAIFAKAINAIRPIEIKKISLDRAKLYSGEKQGSEIVSKESMKNVQVTFLSNSQWNLEDIPPPGTEPLKIKLEKPSKSSPPPSRLSVKERLGCKVEELDKLTKEDKPFERNRSRSLSPLSKRNEEASRNVSVGERRIELDDRRRDDYRRQDDRSRHDSRSRHDHRRHERDHDKDRRYRSHSRSRELKASYRDRRPTERKDYRRDDRRERDDRRAERSRSRHRTDRRHDHRDDRHRDDKRETREREKINSRSRRSKSRSDSRDHKDKRKKSRDKKHKKEKDKEKEKVKKHKKSDDESEDIKQPDVKVESKVLEKKHDNSDTKSVPDKYEKVKTVDERRKPTLDEASFEPDYDLESESEKEESKMKAETAKKRERSKSPDSKNVQDTSLKKRKVDEPERKSPKDSSSSESSDSSSDDGRHKKKHRKHKKKKSRKDSSSSSSSSDSDSSADRKSKKRHKSNRKIKKKKKSKHK